MMSSSQQAAAVADAQGAEDNEWLPLLVSCVALRQGLLPLMLRSLGNLPAEAAQADQALQTTGVTVANSAASSPPSELLGQLSVSSSAAQQEHGNALTSTCSPGDNATDKQPWVWGRHQPTLLHLLAHELGVMKDASPVGFSDQISLSGQSSSQQPWQAAMSCVVQLIQQAAQECQQQASSTSSTSSSSSGTGTEAPPRALVSYVLEAAFEVGCWLACLCYAAALSELDRATCHASAMWCVRVYMCRC